MRQREEELVIQKNNLPLSVQRHFCSSLLWSASDNHPNDPEKKSYRHTYTYTQWFNGYLSR